MSQARKRVYNQEDQSHFAKKHEMLNRQYMTDFDGMQSTSNTGEVVYSDSENVRYMEWNYVQSSSNPSISRIVETKSRKTKYIEKVLKGEQQPSEQFKAFAQLTTELNGFRRANNQQEIECWLVVENCKNYPYEVYKVIQVAGGDVRFEFLFNVHNDIEYKERFQS